ncbi:MAG: nucleotidyltransferase, partial [Lachnospiraceae bacterium]|nr:nucleotidyltransferase [Lachnospiraceae bacterium]
TEHGPVPRGVCETSEEGKLLAITERTHIERRPDGPAYTEDDGASWYALPENAPVSMNLWGFTPSILRELKERFPAFLDKGLKENPLKCEYFLPFVVDELIREGKAEVTVLKSHDRWHGVTYKEDKPVVVAALQALKDTGRYPQELWPQS